MASTNNNTDLKTPYTSAIARTNNATAYDEALARANAATEQFRTQPMR